MQVNFLSLPLCLRRGFALLFASLLILPSGASCEELDRSVGGYVGQYYDSEPAGFSQGSANYLNQYLVALTGTKTFWRSNSWPVSLELDAMIGLQFGLVTLSEVAIAPALRWSGFPWRDKLQIDLRVAPLGVSYTSAVSPLERGPNGQGAQWLNWLFIELAFSGPESKSNEYFVRLHHRCTVYDLLNDYGANGEDFLTVGYRYRF